MTNVQGLLHAPNSRDNLDTYLGATGARYQAYETISSTVAPVEGTLMHPLKPLIPRARKSWNDKRPKSPPCTEFS